MKNGLKTMKDAMKEFVESRDNAIPLFELGAMDSDIRGRALTLYGLEIAGAQEDSDVRALGGDHLEAVCKELEELRKGKSARVKVLVGKFQRALQEHHSHLQETRPMAGGLSDGYLSALTKWGVALRREGDALKGFFRAADDAGWMDGDKKREVGAKVGENGKAKPPAGRGTGKRGKRAAIKIEVAAAYMKKGTRTLQRWEKNPGLVPDEWVGYSRAVRMTGTDWEAWKVSLGMREGTQGQLRNASKLLGDGWSSTHTTRR